MAYQILSAHIHPPLLSPVFQTGPCWQAGSYCRGAVARFLLRPLGTPRALYFPHSLPFYLHLDFYLVFVPCCLFLIHVSPILQVEFQTLVSAKRHKPQEMRRS